MNTLAAVVLNERKLRSSEVFSTQSAKDALQRLADGD
jgi:hypothetical protein